MQWNKSKSPPEEGACEWWGWGAAECTISLSGPGQPRLIYSFSNHTFHAYSMSGSKYFTNRMPFLPRHYPMNKCHYPHFTDRKTEAQRGELTCMV